MSTPEGFFTEGKKVKPITGRKGINESSFKNSDMSDRIEVDAIAKKMKLSKTQRERIAKLEDHKSVLTEQDILNIKNNIAGGSSFGAWQREKPLSAYQEKMMELIDKNENGFPITSEQTEKGLNWLKQNRIYKNMSNEQKQVFDNFKEFRFMGFEDVGNQYRRLFIPIYRIVSKTGDYFDYYASAIGSQSAITEV